MKGLDKEIGSWAALEDVKEPKDGQVLVKTNRLLGQGRGLVIINRLRCSRSYPSSTNGVEA